MALTYFNCMFGQVAFFGIVYCAGSIFFVRDYIFRVDRFCFVCASFWFVLSIWCNWRMMIFCLLWFRYPGRILEMYNFYFATHRFFCLGIFVSCTLFARLFFFFCGNIVYKSSRLLLTVLIIFQQVVFLR